MKRQIKHMIKYKYLPFSTGKKVRAQLLVRQTRNGRQASSCARILCALEQVKVRLTSCCFYCCCRRLPVACVAFMLLLTCPCCRNTETGRRQVQPSSCSSTSWSARSCCLCVCVTLSGEQAGAVQCCWYDRASVCPPAVWWFWSCRSLLAVLSDSFETCSWLCWQSGQQKRFQSAPGTSAEIVVLCSEPAVAGSCV